MKQLWTLYPHTPDNSFLGFAMQLPDHTVPRSERKNQAVLYGKEGCNYILYKYVLIIIRFIF